MHDPLTDALNRNGMHKALERRIEEVRRYDNRNFVIVQFDLDNFKKINVEKTIENTIFYCKLCNTKII